MAAPIQVPDSLRGQRAKTFPCVIEVGTSVISVSQTKVARLREVEAGAGGGTVSGPVDPVLQTQKVRLRSREANCLPSPFHPLLSVPGFRGHPARDQLSQDDLQLDVATWRRPRHVGCDQT